MVLHYSLVENCTINTMTSVKSQQLSLNDCWLFKQYLPKIW
jgi:hypothetical protein